MSVMIIYLSQKKTPPNTHWFDVLECGGGIQKDWSVSLRRYFTNHHVVVNNTKRNDRDSSRIISYIELFLLFVKLKVVFFCRESTKPSLYAAKA